MFESESAVFARLERSALIAVLILEREDDAVPVAEALLAGGVDAMELTFRTPAAPGALRRIRTEVPQMQAGAGTILTPAQAREAADCGAAFGVAPGMNPSVVAAAIDAGLPFAPGICTPSDIERALEFDRRLLKFFPAEASGGLRYLETIAAPYRHLNLRYIPLGGLNPSNCALWLGSPLIAGIGGSWLAPKDAIDAKNWSGIADRARQAIEIRDSSRKSPAR